MSPSPTTSEKNKDRAAVSATGLSKFYGKLQALDKVTLTIEPGECVALVGPNGAGKSTLFKLCLGLLAPSAGAISILEKTPGHSDFNETKKNIGFLPEQVLFHGALTGRETLKFFARLKGANLSQIDHLFERVQLTEAAKRRVSTYSKGMRQRLGLAQALIGTPDLLMLDEPMSGLDPQARINFFKIIDEEKARGAAIILSSHILTELEAKTDRVAILSQGKLKALGPINHLRNELNLQSRIRIRSNPEQMQELAQFLSSRFPKDCFMNGTAVLACSQEQKLALLKDLFESNLSFENLDIQEPSLEQVFAIHTSSEASS